MNNIRKLLKSSFGLSLFLLAACSGGETNLGFGECEKEACPCYLESHCPEGWNCLNGTCTKENPFAGQDAVLDDSRTGDNKPEDGVTEDTKPDAPQDTETEVQTDIVSQLGMTCQNNDDCAAGWCIDSLDGPYCTVPCTGECPEGWTCRLVPQTIPDSIYVCTKDKNRLCERCEIDAHCGNPGDRCLEIGGGHYCGSLCSGSECPVGYECKEFTVEEQTFNQCVPLNGSCDCSSENAGIQKACTRTNEFGTCTGVATCNPEAGWENCTALEAVLEDCDGKDNDCDGIIDEDLSSKPCEITTEFGTCTGVEACQGIDGWACLASNPIAEMCNGVDDNCDGTVDEGFVNEEGLFLTLQNCGTCGNDCTTKFGGADEVECALVDEVPSCRILSCQPGYYLFNDQTCISETTLLCQPCVDETDCLSENASCVPVQPSDTKKYCARSCDGLTPLSGPCPDGYQCADVDGAPLCLPMSGSCDCTVLTAGQVKPCVIENELGTCFGQESCDPMVGWVGCTALTPAEEIPDCIDNDCDGTLDENGTVSGPCEVTNEFGTCAGVLTCGLAGTICTAKTPATEVCNGQDDNCDGHVDEGYATEVGDPVVLKYGLSVNDCGACNYSCPAVAHGEVGCDATPAMPVCTVVACEEGYYNYLGLACLELPTEALCRQCVSDADCEGPGDVCVAYPDGNACGRDCGAGSIYETELTVCSGAVGTQDCCPDGYTCSQVGTAFQCLPASGSCTCTSDGLTESCAITNVYGSCPGVRTCRQSGSALAWSDCEGPNTPSAELCDGIDNDCDGLIDGTDPSQDYTGTPTGTADCTNGLACTGSWICSSADWFCSAKTVATEFCDGQDNDCDGVADNGFIDPGTGLYLSDLNCGGCGFECSPAIPNSVTTACLLVSGIPTCQALECVEGYFPAQDGTFCRPLVDTLCQPCTDHANCLVPSSLCMDLSGAGGERICGRDCSAASPFGEACPSGYTCTATMGSMQCVPNTGSCVCNAESAALGLTRSCTIPGGCLGVQECEATGPGPDFVYMFSECTADETSPEVCDGTDNDCDGAIDEGYTDAFGEYSFIDNCGGCGNNCAALWSEPVHHATGACVVGLDGPTCEIASCFAGAGLEWVNVNGYKADGCECVRLESELAVDNPDESFLDPITGLPVYPSATASYVDQNCDGIDGVVGDALFVSAAAAVGGSGTLAAPFKTISAAITAFPASGKKYILVAGGVYEESIALSTGLALHGGYAPDFRSRNVVSYPTEIRGQLPDFANPASLRAAVTAKNINGPAATVVSGFYIRGVDINTKPSTASQAGYSTYAVQIVDSNATLRMLNNRILGGIGGDGTDGSLGTAGQAGGSGSTGETAGSCRSGATQGVCTTQSRAGGAGGTNGSCGGTTVNGHEGGDATCPVYNQPSYSGYDAAVDGAPGYHWSFDQASDSNCSSHITEAGFPVDIQRMSGGDGKHGITGVDGQQGTGCQDSLGAVSGGLWVAPVASTGALGAHGTGGGAGAPSGGIDSYSPTGASGENIVYYVQGTTIIQVKEYNGEMYKLGAGGGGGGAGGCGGSGGQPGGSGGASFALLVTWSSPAAFVSFPVLAGNIVRRGLGGDGGRGGYGGTGGLGGDGAVGGTSESFWVDYRGGSGGRGGTGGFGGGGGGGCGGPSLGLAVYTHPVGQTPAYASANAFELDESTGTGGQGGPAGASGTANPSATGVTGASYNLYTVPQ